MFDEDRNVTFSEDYSDMEVEFILDITKHGSEWPALNVLLAVTYPRPFLIAMPHNFHTKYSWSSSSYIVVF